jgi:hypothetical protein
MIVLCCGGYRDPHEAHVAGAWQQRDFVACFFALIARGRRSILPSG